MGRDIALSEAAKHLSALGKGFERTVAKVKTRKKRLNNYLLIKLPNITCF
jgi:hypothetical protein